MSTTPRTCAVFEKAMIDAGYDAHDFKISEHLGGGYMYEKAADMFVAWQAAIEAAKAAGTAGEQCTCPSGDGSLRWPCPQHPPLPVAITDKTGPNGIKWYVEPSLPDGVNLYIKEQK